MTTEASLPAGAPAPELRQILLQIAERMSEFMGVERSTIYLYDEAHNELWTPAAQGLAGAEEIRLQADRGIAGSVFQSGEALRIDDPYHDPRFLPDVDRRTGFRTRNMYCRPLQTSAGHRIGVIQLLNKREGVLTERDVKLLDVLSQQAAIALENAQLYHGLRKVRDSEQALHAELSAKHAELQKAFVEIEHANAQRERLERTMRQVRAGAMGAVVVLFLLLGVFAWRSGGHPATVAAHEGATELPPPGSLLWRPVTTGPVSSTLALLGNIEPVEIVHLTSPFRGRVAEKDFEYGELVEKGQLLARIDSTELEVDLRNAEITLIKARTELKRLETWQDGPEVARAQRGLRKVRLSYEANARNLKEMEKLSTLGIIATSTLDSARQRLAVEETDLKAAEEDLTGVLATASEERITIARYDARNAQLRVDELRQKLARAEIHAPFSGIVILPNARPIPNRNPTNQGFFETGTTINQGEVLLSIGNLEAVAVRTRADEVDVSRIRHGQPVRITGEALPGVELAGEVSFLSSQAILTNGPPYFEVAVKTGTLTDEERAAVRLGMTAKLEILVYHAASATLVPVNAVFSENGQVFVWHRPGGGGKAERVAVEVGVITPTVAEIRHGLAPNDSVALDPAAVGATELAAP